MRVRRGDLIWLTIFLLTSLVPVLPGGLEILADLAESGRCRFGALVFAVCGPLGEALHERFRFQRYPDLLELAVKALLWSLFGLAASVLFWVVNGGVAFNQAAGLLPGGGYGLGPNYVKVFLTSFFFTEPLLTGLFLCLGPIPFLLAALQLGEALGRELREGRRPTVDGVVARVDWRAFARREFGGLPVVRLMALTVVFMLPSQLWLYMAAWLGAILYGLWGLSGPRRKTA